MSPNEDEIELWSLTVEDGLTPKSERYNREFLVKKDNNFKEVRPGDIVYNPMNMTLGAVGYNGMAKSVAVSGYYTTMITKKGYDAYYINTWLKSPQAILLYKTYATGSLIEKQRVQFPTLSIMPASFPNYDEQTKIGQYFESLDNLITLHQRKYFIIYNKLITWEQRKLGELGEIMTGSTPSTSKSEYYSEEGIPWVTPTDINALTISDTPKKLSEKGMKVGRVVPANTILCTCIASIGKNALLTVKGSFNQQINSLTPSAENDSYFLLTESELWSEKMKRMAASGTMQIVNKTEFSELDTMVPSLDEQKIIGSYFRNIDNLITLHRRAL